MIFDIEFVCTYFFMNNVATISFDAGGGGTANDGVTPFVCLPAGGTAGYQILAPAYYDQNGQLVMGNGRGIGTPVRLVPPTPILVNATGQQGMCYIPK